MLIFEIKLSQKRLHLRFCQKNFQFFGSKNSKSLLTFELQRVSTNYITRVLKALNNKSKSMQKSDSIQPRSCLIQKKHVAELVRRRSKNLKFSEKIVGLVKITLNYIYKSRIRRVAIILTM